MTETIARPPYDHELVPVLEEVSTYIPQRLTAEMIPALRAGGGPSPEQLYAALGIEWRDVTITSHDGYQLTASVYQRPGRTGTGPGVYYLHGGGMIFGDRHGGPSAFTDLVLEHDAVVVSLEYRLAPENQDPVPVEDCYAGLVWTSEHLEELGVEPGNLMIAGHSGGGGLAAGAALLARDRRGPHLRAQLLMSPMLDDRATSASSRQFQSSGTLSRDSIDVAWQCVLGDRHGGDEVSPYAAPARAADLSGLPTTYIDCGSAEVFRDEATAYATDIWAAGGQAELHVWAGGFHGFDTMAPDAAVSRAAVAARQDWMERVLGL